MNTTDKIKAIQALMKENKIDCYYVPTADFHNSEYVGDYFKARAYLSGFSGSAGVMVIKQETAYLWTDGRYFIQAAKQLANSGIELMRMNEPGVLSVEEFLASHLPINGTMGFDGRVVMAKQFKAWKTLCQDKNISFVTTLDLVGQCWLDRPALPKESAYLLNEESVGETRKEKLNRLRVEMKKNKADIHFVATLDDLAWIFNLRGNDVLHSPVVLAYGLIEMDKATLFIDGDKLSNEVKMELSKDKIECLPYEDVYQVLTQIPENQLVMLDESNVNMLAVNSLKAKIISCANPSMMFKAIKNNVELEHTRVAHIKDGVAVSKFMIWLKKTIQTETLNEIQVADQLESYRRENKEMISLSFNTIAAYGANAASMHYSATPEQFATLKREGFLLVDSGATYFNGTTDITRTFALGECSEALKKDYTSVLKGMLSLSMAVFLYGVRGANLDVLARTPMWKRLLDYKCGTGHGVGHILNVHEGPNSFRWQTGGERGDSCILEEGMITTNEPGIYIDGSHGIRIENEMITKKKVFNEYGQFMEFETITFAPIDLDPVLPELLSQDEKDFLNAYHEEVYQKVSPYLNEEECKALRIYTRAI